MDEQGKSNILHYSTFNSLHVTISVLSVELFAYVHAFDYASTIHVTPNEIFGRKIPLKIYTDSKSIFIASQAYHLQLMNVS